MKKERKIALILPYFGKFPNYFNLWLETASYNLIVDFYIFTDNRELTINKDNIIINYLEFSEIKNMLEMKLKEKIKLETPYKLCDYKPLYGLIFFNYIKSYTHWGHCDPDIIWGDLSKFLTPKILNNYDKIYTKGHLTIYKNNLKINNLVLSKQIKSKFINFNDVKTTNYNCYFDEGEYINELFRSERLNIYLKSDCADILYKDFRFRLASNKEEFRDLSQVYIWKKGKLIGYFLKGEKIEEKEFSYIHLQKRRMLLGKLDKESFKIVPNMFSENLVININELKKYSREDTLKEKLKYIKMRIIRKVNNLRKGALRIKIKLIIKKLNN